MDDITLGIIVAGALALGWTLARHFYIKMFHEILRDLGIKEHQLLKLMDEDDSTVDQHRPTIELIVEQHQGMFYAYNKSGMEFLAQAASADLIVEKIASQPRFQGYRFLIADDDGAEHFKKTVDNALN